MSVFSKRGISVEVVTTEVTELDAALFGVSDERLEEFGKALKRFPLSIRDVDLGGARIRTFEDFDVAFLVTADGDSFVLTIGNIQPISHEPRLERLLRKVAIVATLRGATGI